MSSRGFFLFSLVVVLLCGCESNKYEVSMVPKGHYLNRELVCYRDREGIEIQIGEPKEGGDRTSSKPLSSFPAKELDRVAAAYGSEVPKAEAKKHSFKGTFAGALPDDLGGAGSYTHFESPLGELTLYGERMRGRDDAAGALQEGLKSIDRLVDHGDAWLETLLGNEAWWSALHDLIDLELRQDVKNLVLQVWMVGGGNISFEPLEERQQRMKDMAARMALYLVERDYLIPEELPRFVRTISAADVPQDPSNMDPYQKAETERAAMLELLRSMFARKLQVPESDQVFQALADLFRTDEETEASLRDYFKTTTEWKRVLARWEKEKALNPDLEPPDPENASGEFMQELFEPIMPLIMPIGSASDGAWFLMEIDGVSLRMASTVEPTATNGDWDAEKKEIRWLGTMYEGQSPPAFTYACWVVPHEGHQMDRFGQVLLEKEALAEYVIWYAGLSEQEAAEWEAFLDGVQPGEDLAKQFEKRVTLCGNEKLADKPRGVIRKALEKKN